MAGTGGGEKVAIESAYHNMQQEKKKNICTLSAGYLLIQGVLN